MQVFFYQNFKKKLKGGSVKIKIDFHTYPLKKVQTEPGFKIQKTEKYLQLHNASTRIVYTMM
jgi:hypothetical protein